MNLKLVSFITGATIIGASLPFILLRQKTVTISAPTFIPSKSLYQRSLPSDWLVGTVTDIGPSAQVETRYGTEFEDLSVGTTISLGEDIKTGPQDDSLVSILFDNFLQFNIGSNTRLNFTNTNPQNFLISLNRGGNLEFDTFTDSGEFSITSLHLLSSFTGASGNVSVDEEYININLTKGSVKIGYNDTDYKTQIQEISAPKKIIYNDETRTVKLKNL